MTERASASPGPFLIGVTGNIACGKSTVMRELASLGAETFDADVIYHELIEPGKPLWHAIVDHFGVDVLGADQAIDRRKLGEIVFANRQLLSELEQLTHPVIRDEIMSRVAASDNDVVAIDAVKLVEGQLHHQCDTVWVVTCRPEQQLARLMEQRGLSTEAAKARLDAQPPVDIKVAVADLVIDNSGAVEETLDAVRSAWNQLRPLFAERRAERHQTGRHLTGQAVRPSTS